MESKDRAPNTAALHGSSGGLPESSRAAALGSCPKTLGGLGELRRHTPAPQTCTRRALPPPSPNSARS
ncbi:MAG: hypothetical protein KDD55_00145, partial [Bdellovibrionales bacterium]|nr:hypothetical protein [Bdellovibrionales bacterium]